MKFSSGNDGYTRMSALWLLTDWTFSVADDAESCDVKIIMALLAFLTFPVRRKGKTARDA